MTEKQVDSSQLHHIYNDIIKECASSNHKQCNKVGWWIPGNTVGFTDVWFQNHPPPCLISRFPELDNTKCELEADPEKLLCKTRNIIGIWPETSSEKSWQSFLMLYPGLEETLKRTITELGDSTVTNSKCANSMLFLMKFKDESCDYTDPIIMRDSIISIKNYLLANVVKKVSIPMEIFRAHIDKCTLNKMLKLVLGRAGIEFEIMEDESFLGLSEEQVRKETTELATCLSNEKCDCSESTSALNSARIRKEKFDLSISNILCKTKEDDREVPGKNQRKEPNQRNPLMKFIDQKCPTEKEGMQFHGSCEVSKKHDLNLREDQILGERRSDLNQESMEQVSRILSDRQNVHYIELLKEFSKRELQSMKDIFENWRNKPIGSPKKVQKGEKKEKQERLLGKGLEIYKNAYVSKTGVEVLEADGRGIRNWYRGLDPKVRETNPILIYVEGENYRGINFPEEFRELPRKLITYMEKLGKPRLGLKEVSRCMREVGTKQVNSQTENLQTDSGRFKDKLKRLEPWRKTTQTLASIWDLQCCGDWRAAKEVIPTLSRQERRLLYNLSGMGKYVASEEVNNIEPLRPSKENKMLSQMSVFKANPVRLEADLIVYPTFVDGSLRSKLSRDIEEAAGPLLGKENLNHRKSAVVGQVKIAGGFRLPATNVANMYVPKNHDLYLLKKAYQRIFDEAKEMKLKSIVVTPTCLDKDSDGQFTIDEIVEVAMQEAYQFLLREKESNYKIIFATENENILANYRDEAERIYQERQEEEEDPVLRHVFGKRKLPQKVKPDKKSFDYEQAQLVNELLQMADLECKSRERSLQVDVESESPCPKLKVNNLKANNSRFSDRTRDSLIKFCGAIGAKDKIELALILFDLGAEESIISQKIFEMLREGEDYVHLKKVSLTGPGGIEIETVARIRILPRAGIRLKPYLEPIGFTASVSCLIGSSYDILFSKKTMESFGKVKVVIEENEVPIITVQNTPTKELLRIEGGDSNSELAKTIILDVVSSASVPVRSVNAVVLEPRGMALVQTSNTEASQIMTYPGSDLSVNSFQRNFTLENGKPIRKKGKHQIVVRNISNMPVQIRKNQTVCLEVLAKDGIICQENSRCGRFDCPCMKEELNGENNDFEARERDEQDLKLKQKKINREKKKLKKLEKKRIREEEETCRRQILNTSYSILKENVEAQERNSRGFHGEFGNLRENRITRIESMSPERAMDAKKRTNDNELNTNVGKYTDKVKELAQKGKIDTEVMTQLLRTAKDISENDREEFVKTIDSELEKLLQKMKPDEEKEWLNNVLGNIPELAKAFQKGADKQTKVKFRRGTFENDVYSSAGREEESSYVKVNNVDMQTEILPSFLKEMKQDSQTRQNGQKCKDLILSKMWVASKSPDILNRVLRKDCETLERIAPEAFGLLIEKEEMEEFSTFFTEASMYSAKGVSIPDTEEQYKKMGEIPSLVNSYRQLKRGIYYYSDPIARIFLKLIFYHFRANFCKYKWEIGKIRPSFFRHSVEWKDREFFKKRVRPFRNSPEEKSQLKEYLSRLLTAKLITPTHTGYHGVNIFLISKPGQEEPEMETGKSKPAFSHEMPNEGTERLRKELESLQVNIVSASVNEGLKQNSDDADEGFYETEFEDDEERLEYRSQKELGSFKLDAQEQLKWQRKEAMLDENNIDEGCFDSGTEDLEDDYNVDEGAMDMDMMEESSQTMVNNIQKEQLGVDHQFDPNWSKPFVNKIVEAAYATSKSDRIQSRDRDLKPGPTRKEVKKLLDLAFTMAIEAHQTDGIRVLQRNEKYEREYLDYLKEQRKYYNDNISVNTDLRQINDLTRPEQKKYRQELLSKLPLYLSMALGNSLLVLNYAGSHIMKLERISKWTAGLGTVADQSRTPVYLATKFVRGEKSYFPVRIKDKQFSNSLMLHMVEHGLKTMKQYTLDSLCKEFFYQDIKRTGQRVCPDNDDEMKISFSRPQFEEEISTQHSSNMRDSKKAFRIVSNCVSVNKSMKPGLCYLPDPDTMIQRLAGGKILNSLDLSQFYFQIGVDEDYSNAMTLCTSLGFYKPSYVLQGDALAPQSAQFCSNAFIKDVDKGVNLIDDLAYSSQDTEGSLNSLFRILQNINYVSLPGKAVKIRSDKVNLFQESLYFCGRVLKGGKVSLVSHKMGRYLTRTPRTVAQMSSFVCFANYFTSHLSDPIRFLKPLRQAMVNKSKASLYPWTEALSEKYKDLVDQLKNLPSLFIAEIENREAKYFLFTDASSDCIGSLLCMEKIIKDDGHKNKDSQFLDGMEVPKKFSNAKDGERGVLVPIAYYSRQFQGAETNYSIVSSELLAVTASLERFQHLIRGRSCVILSDNSFVYTVVRRMKQEREATPKISSPVLARLAEQLCHLQLDIGFLRSELNPSDFLSRTKTDSGKSVDPYSDKNMHFKRDHLELPKVSENGHLITKSKLEDYRVSDEQPQEERIEQNHNKWSKTLRKAKRKAEMPKIVNSVMVYERSLEEELGQKELEHQCQQKLDKVTQLVEDRIGPGKFLLKTGLEHLQLLTNSSLQVNESKIQEKEVRTRGDTFVDDIGFTGLIEARRDLAEKQRDDPSLEPFFKEFEDPYKTEIIKGSTKIVQKEGILLAVPQHKKSQDLKYILPKSLQHAAVLRVHLLAHIGQAHLNAEIRKRFYWSRDTGHTETIEDIVKRVCNSCIRCQFFSSKRRNPVKITLPLVHTSINRKCASVWFLDFWSAGLMPVGHTQKYSHMIAACCGRCRFAVAEAVKGESSEVAMSFIFNNLLTPQIPRTLITDNASTLLSNPIKSVLEAANESIKTLSKEKKDRLWAQNEPPQTVETSSGVDEVKWQEAQKRPTRKQEEEIVDIGNKIELVPIIGDGSCLYRAVAVSQALSHQEELNPEEIGSRATALRKHSYEKALELLNTEEGSLLVEPILAEWSPTSSEDSGGERNKRELEEKLKIKEILEEFRDQENKWIVAKPLEESLEEFKKKLATDGKLSEQERKLALEKEVKRLRAEAGKYGFLEDLAANFVAGGIGKQLLVLGPGGVKLVDSVGHKVLEYQEDNPPLFIYLDNHHYSAVKVKPGNEGLERLVHQSLGNRSYIPYSDVKTESQRREGNKVDSTDGGKEASISEWTRRRGEQMDTMYFCKKCKTFHWKKTVCPGTIGNGTKEKKKEETDKANNKENFSDTTIHKNSDVDKISHFTSSPYHPSSHSLIERLFLSLAECMRRLLATRVHEWHKILGTVIALYNLKAHRALRYSSPASLHYNLPDECLVPDIYQIIESSTSPDLWVQEKKARIKQAEEVLKPFQEKYFSSMDKAFYKHHKISRSHGFEIGDLVLLRRMQRTRKFEVSSYFIGPAIVVGFSRNQQLKVAWLLTGRVSKRNFNQAKHFHLPVMGDEQEAKKYYAAPQLTKHLIEGQIPEDKRLEMIEMIEQGVWDRQYIKDLNELNLLVEWNLTDWDQEDFEKESYSKEELDEKFAEFEKRKARGEIPKGSSETNKYVAPQFHITPENDVQTPDQLGSEDEGVSTTFNEEVRSDRGDITDLQSSENQNTDDVVTTMIGPGKVKLKMGQEEAEIEDIGVAKPKRRGRPTKNN